MYTYLTRRTQVVRTSLCIIVWCSVFYMWQKNRNLQKKMSCSVLLLIFLLVGTCNADQASFDCKMRQLAMDYARKIQPWLSTHKLQEMADALNGARESQNCSVSAQVSATPSKPPQFSIPTGVSTTFFVDTNTGSDSNSGSESSPFKTIPKAIDASRKAGPANSAIILRSGTFYLTDTIELNAKDSGLTIMNYKGENVTISGGKMIKPDWQEFDTKHSMNIYKADMSSVGIDTVMGLRINGKRAIRARYPNADPETQGFGSSLKAQKWLPPKTPQTPGTMENPSTPNRTSAKSYQTFQLGINGSCEIFDPPAGFFCKGFKVPSGMVANASVLPHQPYKKPEGAVVQVWRPSHWNSWMFEVGSYESNSGTFSFSKGGFQGARGNDNGAEFYIENIMEELDSPNEWFYDMDSKTLYFFHNASSGTPPPADAVFVVPVLKVLFNVSADQTSPAKDISIMGIQFRDTAYTYMDPHGMPSGGDWGLQRTATLFFEGTENLLIQECLFERLDGNAIMLSGYHRNATIYKNEFVWIGDTAIAAWGDTTGSSVKGMGWDGTQGDQPRFTQILYNFAHELGIFEKQSSFYFQAKTCQTSLKGNIFFNGPRAGINFNDGFGGGSNLTENILFNTCRESGDHGPFNSWDRQVYVTKVRTGKPSPDKEWDYIFKNFVIANYNSQEAIDNDDCSNYYQTHSNFFVYSGRGMKNDFGGHDNHHFNNTYAYAGVGFKICQQLIGHEDYFYNNTLVMTRDGDYGDPQCSSDGTYGATVLHDNKIYTPKGNVTECGMSLADWQAKGNDKGSTASTFPPDEDLIMKAKKLLDI